MVMKRPILVICVDRDNDLYEKAHVSGPLIGREKNLDGATRLALADPEDPDSNAIFYSIKLLDQIIPGADKDLVAPLSKRISRDLTLLSGDGSDVA